MMGLRISIVAAAMALGLLASGAQGQFNPLRELALTDTDIEMLTAAANHVYEAGEVGVAESWSNPASGNSGTAEILERFERDGLPCRRVEHVIKVAKDAVPKRVVLATCRVADGRWLLV
jgi:surface antigen